MNKVLLGTLIIIFLVRLVQFYYKRSKRMPPSQERDISSKDVLRLESYLRDFTYYKHLSADGKIKFMNRLIEFMLSKRWEGWDDLVVTEEMKVLVSACAVQLTFGMGHYIFPHFGVIRLYPKAYYYKLTDQYFKGGTSENGVISLSWKHFLEGYREPDDKLNLGLHEWAHALKIDLSSEDDFDSRFLHYLENWEQVSFPEFSKMHQGERSFLRAYAGTNMHEFFAVCIEHFFEVPKEFNKYLPDIYHHLSLLLNQDPANTDNDYALEGMERHPKHMKEASMTAIYAEPFVHVEAEKVKIIRTGFRTWPMYLVIAGLFAGTTIIYYVKLSTIISTPLTLMYIAAFGVAGLFQWPYFKRREMLELRHFVMYSFCGFGMCTAAIMFMLNYFIATGDTYTKVLSVKSIEVLDDRYKVKLEDEKYDNVASFSHITLKNVPGPVEARRIKLTLERGLLGMEVVKSVEFVE